MKSPCSENISVDTDFYNVLAVFLQDVPKLKTQKPDTDGHLEPNECVDVSVFTQNQTKKQKISSASLQHYKLTYIAQKGKRTFY